jgi:hypothetical protein
MITISIELLSSFSLDTLFQFISTFCDVLTVFILIIDYKRKKVVTLPKQNRPLSVHRFSKKR